MRSMVAMTTVTTMVVTTRMITVTSTALAATMSTEPGAASFLQLLWLASPALPVGGFSYSEGLEAAVSSGYVATENEAAAWLTDQLHLALSRADLPVLAQAITAWRAFDTETLRGLNAWLLQTRESHELRLQTVQMGRSLVVWLQNHRGVDAVHLECCETLTPCYPVAFALAVASTTASLRDALLAYAFGWAENMTQAAIKAVPLGQSAGQRILAALTEHIPAAVEQALNLPREDWQSFSPMLAILSAQHENQYSRLFRS
jgi:urease accessory protein